MPFKAAISITGSFAGQSAAINAAGAQLVQTTGEAVRDGAKAHSRVDTGEMRDGWTFAMTGPLEGEVFNDVPHTIFNEYGTVKMPAQAMLAPSLDEQEPVFLDGVRALVGGNG